MRGVNFTAYQKRQALRLWCEEKLPVQKVCSKCKCTERSLWRWKKLYNGTLESLEPKSCRPHTPHPNRHTEKEIRQILEVLTKTPGISYCEAFGILRREYAYSRSFGGFYNYVYRKNIRPRKMIELYVPKPYDTPEMLGTKIQIDVKYVPTECQAQGVRFYQYTAIDEATRERFLFPYPEFTVSNTIDFVKRAICYFGYIPSIIQTDNGTEFTYLKNPKKKQPRKHALDELCDKLHIYHQRIRPYTPRQNGKVERSHRTDGQCFYSGLKFETYEELKLKMKEWNERYNQKPHSRLTDRNGKKCFWSPLEKRKDLENLLNEHKENFEKVRFIKNKKTISELYA